MRRSLCHVVDTCFRGQRTRRSSQTTYSSRFAAGSPRARSRLNESRENCGIPTSCAGCSSVRTADGAWMARGARAVPTARLAERSTGVPSGLPGHSRPTWLITPSRSICARTRCCQSSMAGSPSWSPPKPWPTGQADSGQSSRVAAPRAQIAELDRKISALVGAIEAGVDVEQVSTELARRAEKRADLDAKLREEGSRDRPDGGGDTEGAQRPWRHRQDPAERRSRATTAVRLTRGEA